MYDSCDKLQLFIRKAWWKPLFCVALWKKSSRAQKLGELWNWASRRHPKTLLVLTHVCVYDNLLNTFVITTKASKLLNCVFIHAKINSCVKLSQWASMPSQAVWVINSKTNEVDAGCWKLNCMAGFDTSMTFYYLWLGSDKISRLWCVSSSPCTLS